MELNIPEWLMFNHFFKAKLKGSSKDDFSQPDTRRPASYFNANIVGSRIEDRPEHLPLLDLDMECVLVPSSTPGHHHLYINKPVPHDKYVKMIEAMVEAGVLQKGIQKQMEVFGETSLRLPHIKKENEDDQVGPEGSGTPFPPEL